MRLFLPIFITCVMAVLPLEGQEGHPLAGSWHGAWGPAGSQDRKDLTVVMDWDGTAITGLVNPVTDRAALESAELDSSTWTVRFEVALEDDSGAIRRCLAQGKLDKLGSDQRTLAGTWNCGETAASFELVRDRDY